MIASLSFQLSWGCFVGLPILTSCLGGIRVVRHPEGSCFLCEDSKFSRQRTTWPLDHKLLSQNKFTMPLGKTVLQQAWQKRHVPFTCMCQCYTFPCRSYPMQAVNVHIFLAFPNGERQIHKRSTDRLLSTGPTRNSEGHPPSDGRDQLHCKFFALLTCLLSQLPAHPKACPQPPSKSNSEATPSLPPFPDKQLALLFSRKAHCPLLPRLQVSKGGTEDG